MTAPHILLIANYDSFTYNLVQYFGELGCELTVWRNDAFTLEDAFTIERYSHVMHIVSGVRGRLREGQTPLHALASALPMGTVSGAPKIRAMEIIDEVEPVRRGPYGGSFGYIAFDGSLDMALTLRTMVIAGGKIHIQARAGIVADSDPVAEEEETRNKAAALMRAVAGL